MVAADRTRIFDAGVRGGGGNGAPQPGAGLGLALARRLAVEIDGGIECIPAEHGARFLVTVPSA